MTDKETRIWRWSLVASLVFVGLCAGGFIRQPKVVAANDNGLGAQVWDNGEVWMWSKNEYKRYRPYRESTESTEE